MTCAEEIDGDAWRGSDTLQFEILCGIREIGSIVWQGLMVLHDKAAISCNVKCCKDRYLYNCDICVVGVKYSRNWIDGPGVARINDGDAGRDSNKLQYEMLQR